MMNSGRVSPDSGSSSDTPNDQEIDVEEYSARGAGASGSILLDDGLLMTTSSLHSAFFAAGNGGSAKRRMGAGGMGGMRDSKSRRKDPRSGMGGNAMAWEAPQGTGRAQRDDLTDTALVEQLRMREYGLSLWTGGEEG